MQPEEAVTINTTVTDDLSGVKNVILNYTTDNVTWSTINMKNRNGDFWNATIPAFSNGTHVIYAVTAQDNFNNMIASQEMGFEYGYIVVPEFSPTLIFLLVMAVTLLVVRFLRRLRGDGLRRLPILEREYYTICMNSQ